MQDAQPRGVLCPHVLFLSILLPILFPTDFFLFFYLGIVFMSTDPFPHTPDLSQLWHNAHSTPQSFDAWVKLVDEAQKYV